jgi:hypothetical protein
MGYRATCSAAQEALQATRGVKLAIYRLLAIRSPSLSYIAFALFDPSKWVLCLKLLPPDSSQHLRVSVVSRSPVVETDCSREVEGRVGDSKVFQVWSSSSTALCLFSFSSLPSISSIFLYALVAITLVHYLLSVSRAPVFFNLKQTTRLNTHKPYDHQQTSKCRTLFPRSWLRPL